MRREFAVHTLNDQGKEDAADIADLFANTLERLEELCGADGREIAIVRTKLEEACFFAKKAMAQQPGNQEHSR